MSYQRVRKRESLMDPMEGVSNLFDIGIVFALGFMLAMLSALQMSDLFHPEEKVTITREKKDGLEIIVRDGQKVTVRKLSKDSGTGDGKRLGVAYRLKDGSVVYVEE